MYRSKFRPVLSNEVEAHDIGSTSPREGYDMETRPGRARPLHGFHSSKALRFFSLLLHSMLVAIHLLLVVKMVSLVITATTTAFGTIYSALLVFVTQTLSMKRNLRMDQTLTATHDNAAAWTGIGSSVFYLWHQKVVPASILGIFSVFLYLANILVLHVTTPALFSLETFNSSRPVGVTTRGLPAYNWSTDVHNDLGLFELLYAPQSLSSLPSVQDGNTTSLGLYQGTLYDVLDRNTGSDNVTVNATGFNISCGYLPNASLSWLNTSALSVEPETWTVLNGSGDVQYDITNTQPGVVVAPPNGHPNYLNSLMLYSTIPIVDSSNNQGPTVNVTPPMNPSVSSIQIFQCFQSLVNQTAVVDSQSGQIIPGTVPTPGIEKTTSTWLPYAGPAPVTEPPTNPNETTSGNLFIDAWGAWYSVMPNSDFAFAYSSDPNPLYVSIADFYLIQKLNLRPTDQNHPPTGSVTLHDLENTLSTLVATMFWTCHIPPVHGEILAANASLKGDQFLMIKSSPADPPFLIKGIATATEISTQIRLDLSIIAIAAGLVASIFLTLLSLPSSLFHSTKYGDDIPVDGTGILHTMWLYRNHPELATLLPQVEYADNRSLREAGMVRTRLVGGQVRGRRSFDSFDAERLYRQGSGSLQLVDKD
ncbi:hypothetical protein C8R44DRAFT_875668 [Mycena epipterygia]|nr:hypothetical protein C8R44DRAFT_875668 [Mycena epipterygia]